MEHDISKPPGHYRVSYSLDRHGDVKIRENELHAIPISADVITNEDAVRYLACEWCCSETTIRILKLETSK